MNNRSLFAIFVVLALLCGPPGCQATTGVYETPDLAQEEAAFISPSVSAKIVGIDRKSVKSGSRSVPMPLGMRAFMFEHTSGAAGEIAFEVKAAHEYEIRAYFLGLTGWERAAPQVAIGGLAEIQAQAWDKTTNEKVPFEWRARKDMRPVTTSGGCGSGNLGTIKWGS